MAPTLGKRKRVTREQLEQPSRSPSPSSGASDSEDGADLRDIFQRAFEAKFKPLEGESATSKKAKTAKTAIEEQEDAYEEEGSDWSGIESTDDEESSPKVQVIDHAAQNRSTTTHLSKLEKRAYMSSKPPPNSAIPASTKPTKSSTAKDSEDPAEANHLKNDMALQKLLRDSHLLSSSPSLSSGTSPSGLGTSTPTLSATGALRHKSTDLHLRSLGAKRSIHEQKSMPMSMRKGLAAKAKMREEKRRHEAKENGITLEKEVRKRVDSGKRDKGVGGPSVGRFKGGMLTLSRKDVRDITRGGEGGRGGKGRGRGRRR